MLMVQGSIRLEKFVPTNCVPEWVVPKYFKNMEKDNLCATNHENLSRNDENGQIPYELRGIERSLHTIREQIFEYHSVALKIFE